MRLAIDLKCRNLHHECTAATERNRDTEREMEQLRRKYNDVCARLEAATQVFDSHMPLTNPFDAGSAGQRRQLQRSTEGMARHR